MGYRPRITEIGRDGDTVFGATFVVCANDEVIGRAEGFDPSGNGWHEEATRAHNEATRHIQAEGFDYSPCSIFGAYNGGPYKSLVEIHYWMQWTDKDTGQPTEDWLPVLSREQPPPHDVRERVEKIAGDAIDKMSNKMHELAEAAHKAYGTN